MYAVSFIVQDELPMNTISDWILTIINNPRFWSCNHAATNKRSVEQEQTQTTIVHWERNHLNMTIYDPIIEDEILEEIFTLDEEVVVMKVGLWHLLIVIC